MLRNRSRAFVIAIAGLALVVTVQMVEAQSQVGWTEGGQQLPAPRGFSLSVYNQTQDYEIVSLDFDFAGIDPTIVPDLKVDNRTTIFHVKLDYWLAPYLNVFAIAGKVDGTTAIAMREIDLGIPLQLNDLKVNYNGWLYGAGVTLAGGWNHYFTTITYQYNEADLDVATSSITAEVIVPKIGIQLEHGAIWVGALRQKAEEKHQGTFDMPLLGAIPYQVELNEKNPWSYMAGMAVGLGEDWMLIMEGGFGDRASVFASIERRF